MIRCFVALTLLVISMHSFADLLTHPGYEVKTRFPALAPYINQEKVTTENLPNVLRTVETNHGFKSHMKSLKSKRDHGSRQAKLEFKRLSRELGFLRKWHTYERQQSATKNMVKGSNEWDRMMQKAQKQTLESVKKISIN